MKTEPLSRSQDSIGRLLTWAREDVEGVGFGEAAASAEALLESLTGRDRLELYLDSDRQLTPATARAYRLMVGERKARKPVAYITGMAYFYKELLAVGTHCLIPRPETELLIETFLEKSGWQKEDDFSFLDLGTGSGALAVVLLRLFSHAKATITDISPQVLEMAKFNVWRYDLTDRSEILESDLFEACAQKKWDAIVCNPPYLSAADMQNLQPEVKHEPHEALDGGQDGLGFYRRIARQAGAYLKDKGLLLLELGIHQAVPVKALLEAAGFGSIEIFKDHAGIQRVLLARHG